MKQFGFSRAERLHNSREYLQVYRSGARIHRPHFVLYLMPNGFPHSRLGVTISRKVGPPVLRNRIKRSLREVFRHNKTLVKRPCDVVVNVKRSAANTSSASLRQEFVTTVQKWSRKKGGV